MEAKTPRLERLFIAVLYFMFISGAIMQANPESRDFAIQFTPLILLATNGMLVYFILRDLDRSARRAFLTWLGVFYFITLGLEILGVATGLVFGSYQYGAVLGPMIWGAPIIIGLNWLIVILGGLTIAIQFTSHRILLPTAAAVITVLFDMAMEPVAIRLGYWNWDIGYIPLQNYLAWFIISLVAGSILVYLDKKQKVISSKTSIHVLLAQLLFFIILLLNL